MFSIIAVVVAFIVGFVGGFLFSRKHGDRVVADVEKASAVVQNIKDTTKSL